MKDKNNIPKEWFKEFWVWVIIGLPALVIAGCLFVVYIAFSKADLVIENDWQQVKYSKKLEVAAKIQLMAKQKLVHIKLIGPPNIQPELLILKLEHPTLAHLDQKITLYKTKKGIYEGVLNEIQTGPRYASIFPKSNQWRLKGQIQLTSKKSQSL